ncbi:MAG: ABC transporter transmembrane domain-containing protein, partial [Actinomycetota bacterium]
MRGGGMRPRDADAIRARNAAAPKIPDLLPRIAALFRPHRFALIVTGILVVVGAGLTVLPPLLTKTAFDAGLFPKAGHPDFPVLIKIVALMILIYVASAALGVWQTYLTATVGNKVMGSMRVSLFTHLQRMELAFFTRTKTGIIQSRL